jgi:hypothetical protein
MLPRAPAWCRALGKGGAVPADDVEPDEELGDGADLLDPVMQRGLVVAGQEVLAGDCAAAPALARVLVDRTFDVGDWVAKPLHGRGLADVLVVNRVAGGEDLAVDNAAAVR